jgi:predicted Zn-dependent protease
MAQRLLKEGQGREGSKAAEGRGRFMRDAMISTRQRRGLAVLVLSAFAMTAAPVAWAHDPKPGFNVFSADQEVQLGQQAAADAERQLPVLNDRSVNNYVNNIVNRLERVAPFRDYPYQARVVNSSDVNAFALPGGFLYINRGLIEAARTEGELAGVIAHEMAHVALRHGTAQVSKAYAAQLGVGALGQILGGNRNRNSQVWNVIGNIGLSTLFLKFSRNAEDEADSLGAKMMAQAGYNPVEMANFFDLLGQQRGNSRVAQFLSDHPTPANRSQHIRAEARSLGGGSGRQMGSLPTVQNRLRSMPAARRASLRTSR